MESIGSPPVFILFYNSASSEVTACGYGDGRPNLPRDNVEWLARLVSHARLGRVMSCEIFDQRQRGLRPRRVIGVSLLEPRYRPQITHAYWKH